MKILGLDVGEKRIGVAKVDSSTKIALPIGFVEVDGNEWDKIKRLASLNNTNFFVLGLPRSNEGNETKQTLYVRNFAKTLVEKIPDARIRFQDESLTSVEAETRLKSRKKNFEKGEIDAEAASIILQDFIETYSEKEPKIEKKSNLERTAEKAMLKSKKAIDKPKKIILNRITAILISLAAILCIGSGLVFWYFSSLEPVTKNCSDNRCADETFVISEGESIDNIADSLDKAELIRSSFFFKVEMRIHYSGSALRSGTYTLNKGMSTREIIEALINGSKDSDVFSFTILPGETIFDIKDKLKKIGYTEEDIEAAFSKNYDYDFLDGRQNKSLEGFLFGETHEFYNKATVEDIIKTYLNNFGEVIKENDLKTKFEKQGLSLYEGIVLASIVQKEAFPADQATVAQVFISRQKLGIPLGSDVTVSYALDVVDPNRETYTSNADALTIDSCYNTRKYAGLPCGAISNPSLSALLAVANPTDTEYLYFLTGDDGKMYYSYTEAEHNQNAIDHCQVLCNISL